jgi:hypothetical protein
MTVLMRASLSGYLEVVEYLLTLEHIDVNKVDRVRVYYIFILLIIIILW